MLGKIEESVEMMEGEYSWSIEAWLNKDFWKILQNFVTVTSCLWENCYSKS